MKKIIISIFLLISAIGFSKKTEYKVTQNEKIVGKNLITNTDIKGIQYTFPDRINETYLDTSSGYLTIQLRGLSKNEKWLENKGRILQFDLNHKKLLWNKKINYSGSWFQQFHETMILTKGTKTASIDIHNGKEKWHIDNQLFLVEPINKIGFGYRYNPISNKADFLDAVDLNSGKLLWQREIKREYGWNEVFFPDDSTMIIVADGIHKVSLNNGNGWDYETKTGKKDYTGTIAANAAGAALGILTGTFMMSTGHDVVGQLVSNSLVDSSAIYLASYEQIVKLDIESGEIIWNLPFPKNWSSKSVLFSKDNYVYMVNFGLGYMGRRELYIGLPFIAKYDRFSGKEIFNTVVSNEGDPILNFEIKNNLIYVVFQDHISSFSMETGESTFNRDYNTNEIGVIKNLIGNHVYVENEKHELECLVESDTSKLYIYTSNEKVLILDRDLNIKETLGLEDLNYYNLTYENYQFISVGEKTIIIDEFGKNLAELNISSKAFIVGNTLYDQQDDSFMAIDLKDVLGF